MGDLSHTQKDDISDIAVVPSVVPSCSTVDKWEFRMAIINNCAAAGRVEELTSRVSYRRGNAFIKKADNRRSAKTTNLFYELREMFFSVKCDSLFYFFISFNYARAKRQHSRWSSRWKFSHLSILDARCIMPAERTNKLGFSLCRESRGAHCTPGL